MMAALFFAATVSVWAQQKIEFSKPADASTEKEAAPEPAVPANSRWTIGAYNAPKSAVVNVAPDATLPQPVIYQRPNPAAQDAMNRKKNWTLLTPEQILGVKTPEQIMGLPDPKNDNKLSLEEQYLLREGRARNFAATNGRPALRANPSPFGTDRDRQNPFMQGADNRQSASQTDEQKGSVGFFNRLLNPNSAGEERKTDSQWNSVFAQPQQAKPSQQQQDSMERFRTLMQPTTPEDNKAAPANYSKTPPAPARDPFLQPQPAYNPAGRSVPVLEDKISRPAGIKPLPGATAAPSQSTVKRPAWQAQLPPWLQDAPSHNLKTGY
jgi:hypothetical protein